ERAPARRLQPAGSGRPFLLASAASGRPLRPPPLPGLLPDLLRVLRAGTRAEPPLEPAQLALELPPAVKAVTWQSPAPKRLADRAAGLALVGAVAEAAGQSQRGHVLEGLLETLRDVPELQL